MGKLIFRQMEKMLKVTAHCVKGTPKENRWVQPERKSVQVLNKDTKKTALAELSKFY